MQTGNLFRWVTAFALSLFLVPIVLNLQPGTDQTLFLDYAAEMLRGATLYVDVWDNKQPGVFGLYAVSQAIFGFGWSRVLIVYAAWMCLAAATITMVARWAVTSSRFWLMAIPCTLGVIWLRSNVDNIGQIEEWVVLPFSAVLFLTLLSEPPGAPGRIRWIFIGALTALVAMLKIVLAPIAVAIAAAVLLARMLTDRLPLRHAVIAGLWAAAGFFAACLPMLALFAYQGAWEVFWWTTFEYPRLALATAERAPMARLVSSLGWLAKSTFPLVPAALIALVAAWRDPRSPLARVVVGALAWISAGYLMILAQKFSWWEYHMPMLVWPIGLLAALGLAGPLDLKSVGGRIRAFALACCVLGLAIQGAALASKWMRPDNWPHLAASQAAIQTAREVAQSAKPRCGTSVAIGDQLGMQSTTAMKRAMATNAVFWGAYLKEQIERLPAELRAARPDLVFMDSDQREYFARRYPNVLASIESWLAEEYRLRATDALNGRWWERSVEKDEAACAKRAPFVIPGR